MTIPEGDLARPATKIVLDEEPDQCTNIREYIETEGADTDNEAVKEHLENCESCKQWLADRRATGTGT